MRRPRAPPPPPCGLQQVSSLHVYTHPDACLAVRCRLLDIFEHAGCSHAAGKEVQLASSGALAPCPTAAMPHSCHIQLQGMTGEEA